MNTFADLREDDLIKTNGGDILGILGAVGFFVSVYEAVKNEVRQKAEEDALVDLGLMSK